MVGHAASPTPTMYVDVTLTRSKVKVTEHLNFWQLPITAHFYVCPPPLSRGAQNWWLVVIVWDLVYSLSEPDFRIYLLIWNLLRQIKVPQRWYFTTFKWPYISVLGDASVTWLGTLVVLHILRMLIWPGPDPRSRSRSRGFWTSDN